MFYKFYSWSYQHQCRNLLFLMCLYPCGEHEQVGILANQQWPFQPLTYIFFDWVAFHLSWVKTIWYWNSPLRRTCIPDGLFTARKWSSSNITYNLQQIVPSYLSIFEICMHPLLGDGSYTSTNILQQSCSHKYFTPAITLLHYQLYCPT